MTETEHLTHPELNTLPRPERPVRQLGEEAVVNAFDHLFGPSALDEDPAHEIPTPEKPDYTALLTIEHKPHDEPWAQEVYEDQLPAWRTDRLFAPQLPDDTDEDEAPVVDYRYLFDPGLAAPEKIAKGNTYGLEVTPETIADASQELREALHEDARLAEIIEDFKTGKEAVSPEDIVGAIRLDPTLRRRVGLHYLSKLEKFAKDPTTSNALPYRVAVNSGRNPSKGLKTLGDMTSREYVSVLCLAKLDGTFDHADASADKIQYNDTGVELGQHRTAADLIMHDYAIEPDGHYIYVPRNRRPS